MAINLKSTSSVHTDGIKVVVYGMSGAGKTSLIPTLPNPIIISAESGLLSIQGSNIPYIDIDSYESLMESYKFITTSEEANGFDSIAIDSISDDRDIFYSAQCMCAFDARNSWHYRRRTWAKN